MKYLTLLFIFTYAANCSAQQEKVFQVKAKQEIRLVPNVDTLYNRITTIKVTGIDLRDVIPNFIGGITEMNDTAIFLIIDRPPSSTQTCLLQLKAKADGTDKIVFEKSFVVLPAPKTTPKDRRPKNWQY